MIEIKGIKQKPTSEIQIEIQDKSLRDNIAEIHSDTWDELSDRGELIFKAYIGEKSGGRNIADNRPRVMLYKLQTGFHVYGVRAGDSTYWAVFGHPNRMEGMIREDLTNISRRNRGTKNGDDIKVKVNEVDFKI